MHYPPAQFDVRDIPGIGEAREAATSQCPRRRNCNPLLPQPQPVPKFRPTLNQRVGKHPEERAGARKFSPGRGDQPPGVVLFLWLAARQTAGEMAHRNTPSGPSGDFAAVDSEIKAVRKQQETHTTAAVETIDSMIQAVAACRTAIAGEIFALVKRLSP